MNLIPDVPVAILGVHLAALGTLLAHGAVVTKRRRAIRRQNRSYA